MLSGPRWLLSLFFLALLVLAGCGGPTYVVEKYPGAQRSADEVAILRFRGTDEAKLVTVDGERADVRIDEDARLHVEVLPGEHTVGLVRASDLQAPLSRVTLRADAGKVYRFEFGREPGAPPRAYEVDPGSDAIVRDVTIVPERSLMPPPPAPAPPPSSSPPPVTTVPAPAAAAPSDARDAATRWMQAMMRDQLDAAMELSGVPFSWDRKELVDSSDELREREAKVMKDKDHDESKVGAAELVPATAEDLSKWYRGSEPIEVVRFPISGKDDVVLVLVRTSDLKVVGFSD